MKILALLAAALACAASAARAEGPTEIEIRVGDTLNICKAQLTICPVSAFACDDPKIAVIENGPEGALLKAVSPGTTICSVFGHQTALRRVMRVTVR